MTVTLLLSLLIAALEVTSSAVMYINATNFVNIHSYIVSNSQLHLEPGSYYLNSSLVFYKVEDLRLTGINSRIICSSPGVGIIVTNVTNFTIQSITLENCGKNYTEKLYSHIGYDYISFKDYSGSLILHDCTAVVISNVSIVVQLGNVGILAINLNTLSKFTYINIILNCSDCLELQSCQAQVNGILMYHYNNTDMEGNNLETVSYVIHDLQYETTGFLSQISQNVLGILLFQKNYNVSFIIQNTRFNDLHNTSLLYYYGETCGIGVHSNLIVRDVTVINNIGNPQLKMFQIIVYNRGCFKAAINRELYSKQQYNNITFLNCNFTNNTNMKSMIHMAPASTRAITAYLYFNNTRFCYNKNIHYINVERSIEIIFQLTNYIKVSNTNISSNDHSDGNDLISVTNGAFVLASCQLHHNRYYQNIIKLHMSPIFFREFVGISNNSARHILRASKDGSYFTMTDNTTVNITNNTVYMVAKQEHRFGVDLRRICAIQFYSSYGNMDERLHEINNTYQLNMLDNLYMISKYYQNKDESIQNCTWIADSAFRKARSEDVYNRTLNMRNRVIDHGAIRPIPLSVCPCSKESDKENCDSADLGRLSAGQTLRVDFTVPWYSRRNAVESLQINTVTLVVDNSVNDDCVIVESSQLSQTHMNNSCNEYNYTIWPRWNNISLCKLFLGLLGRPEMFFVEIKPCPMGFTRQEDRLACYCDPALNILSITSCNLHDETINRPANSWISASAVNASTVNTNTVNKNFSYYVSPYCPFDYCLSQSSHLNLSDPDSQCQFNRTGLLCGECPHGLSTVFGSSKCENCPNIYLLIIIPIAIAGILLVIMLFILNLTVINGTINTFIFYVNILSINMSMFPSGCQPVSCTVVSLFNLDLGIETCFYDGMDDYAKTWLQLLFPTYLIIIAILLIVTSRYFAAVQRVTAHRALPVLATLFLLSYTKTLRVVCNVLFWYTKVTHLPSNDYKLTWLADTTAKLFGFKFLMLFLICLILFLILLPFNTVLLFARTKLLSKVRVIDTFKPLLDAYFAPYKDKHFYWSGLQLLIRIALYSFTALDKDYKITAITMVLTGLLCIQGILQPFKNTLNNIQESVVLFTLLAVHVATYTETKLLDISLVQILTSISLLCLVTIIILLCCMDRCNRKIDRYKATLTKRLLCFYTNKTCTTKTIGEENYGTRLKTLERDSSSMYAEFQEPLVEFDD